MMMCQLCEHRITDFEWIRFVGYHEPSGSQINNYYVHVKCITNDRFDKPRNSGFFQPVDI